MYRRRCVNAATDEQLAHVLPGTAHHSGHVGKADDVGGDFDQSGLRKCSPHIVDGAQDRSVGDFRTAYKLQGDATGLADTDERVIAAGVAKAIDHVVGHDAGRREHEAQCELVFLQRDAPSLPESDGPPVQPSTLRLICFA